MSDAPPRSLTTAILVLGLSGIAAQTVLLRELLILFSGNEFSVGVIIGSWIIAEAFGALAAGRRARRGGAPARAFFLLTALFSVVFPVTVALTRLYKLLAGLPPDQGVGIGSVFLASLLLLLPAALLHGALFVLACSLWARQAADPTAAAGRVYTLETLGTIAGGLLAGFLLIPRVTSFTAAALVALLNGLALLPLGHRLQGGGERAGPAAGLACLAVGLLVLAGGGELQRLTVARQWQGRELVDYRNSPYQNIAVVRSGEQLTFYADGLPLFAVPDPDIAAVEEFVHLPLLAHPAPQRVLILGGGAGGVLAEVLKHPSVTRVDYVELDPQLLATVTEYAPPASRRELADPRVRLHFRDGRHFLRQSRETYDVILLGTPLPSTLQGNRFYTAEFFALVRRNLATGGILALGAAGSLTYYGPELRAVNGGLQQTLTAAFPQLLVIPGDSNLFLATTALTPLPASPELLADRLRERRLAVRLITPEHLAYRLDPGQREWFLGTIGGAGAVNRDFSPRLLFDHLAYGTALFTPGLRTAFTRLREASLLPLATGALLLGGGLGWLARRRPAIACPAVIAATGFAAMLLELALFCAFQVLQGAMFQAVALLISAFMAGLAAGSWLVTGGPLAGRDSRRLLLAAEGGLLLFSGLLAIFFAAGSGLPLGGTARVYGVILPLLLITGLLTGMEFPLATRLQEGLVPGENATAAATAGTVGSIYGADLLGGWLGGLLGGVLLLPVLGLTGSCLLAAALKGGSLLVLFISRTKR